VRSKLLHELLEADNEDLDDLPAGCLADKKHENISVDGHNEAQLVKIFEQKVIEASDDCLDGLQVERALFVINTTGGCIQSQVDVLKQGEELLAENLAPHLESEEVDTLLEHLEEDIQSLQLTLI